jgi:glycosyltransferase involved in cell wall biosynthesis
MVAAAVLFRFSRQSRRKPEQAISPKTGEPVCITRARAALFKSSFHLIKAVRDESSHGGPFQIIHAHDLVGLDAGARIKKELGGTLIWDAHEIYEDLANPDPVSSANARQIIQEAAPLVDHFITINEGLAAHYRRHHPDLPKAIIIMNATVRAQLPQDDGRLRRALGADPRQKIMLFQGGLSMHRGLPKLVRAATDFPAGWILALMGEGHLEDELRALAKDVNVAAGEQRVHFIPSVPQAELIYWTAGATLGAIPYENVAGNHWFCTPNKLWEYPAAGVPFIAPRLHGISRIVDEYKTGFLFPAEFDSQTISDLMQTTDDASLAEKRANIDRFLREMSWETFTPRLTGLYKMIASHISRAENVAVKRPVNAAPPIDIPGGMRGGEALLAQDR